MKMVHSILMVVLLFSFSCKGGKQKQTASSSSQENTPLKAGEAPSGISGKGNEQALRDAAFQGQTSKVNELIDQHVQVKSTDEDGRTALMLAAYNGHADAAALLLEAGSDVNATDSEGRTALMYASTGAFPETVRLLLSHGARINLADKKEHFTALMYAASEGLPEVTRILLENGADPDMKDVDGDRAVNFASNNNHQKVAELLKSWEK